jgi:hypothetical protein
MIHGGNLISSTIIPPESRHSEHKRPRVWPPLFGQAGRKPPCTVRSGPTSTHSALNTRRFNVVAGISLAAWMTAFGMSMENRITTDHTWIQHFHEDSKSLTSPNMAETPSVHTASTRFLECC